jgi:hypothetical protein
MAVEVLIVQVPEARVAKLSRLHPNDRVDALKARVVIAVDGRRWRVIKNDVGESVLHVQYRVAGRLGVKAD